MPVTTAELYAEIVDIRKELRQSITELSSTGKDSEPDITGKEQDTRCNYHGT